MKKKNLEIGTDEIVSKYSDDTPTANNGILKWASDSPFKNELFNAVLKILNTKDHKK